MNYAGYRVIKTLGEGGNSRALLARDIKSGKKVTIKQLKTTGVCGDEIAGRSLANEAEILKNLHHPGIPRLIEYNEDYLILEYVPGVSAEKKILQKGLFSEKAAVETALAITDILEYLHSGKVPVIYRDLKPSNVIISPKGKTALIDFGTARYYRKNEKKDTNNLGTLGYAAPEQFGNLGQTDKRTDIYCLGMTLLQLVSGVDPRDEEAVARYKRCGVKGVSKELLKIIDKCTRPDREDRFENVSEVARELRNYPGRRRLKLFGQALKISLASAAAAFVIASTLLVAEDEKEKVSVSFEEHLPGFRERMNNVRVRINLFIEEQFGETKS